VTLLTQARNLPAGQDAMPQQSVGEQGDAVMPHGERTNRFTASRKRASSTHPKGNHVPKFSLLIDHLGRIDPD
jgi:hypothetical protein